MLKDVEIVEGKPLELVAEASGTPKPVAEWFKGDKPLAESDRVKISSVENAHKLVIENSSEELDSGVYLVRFKNDFGTSETKSNVTILSKPLIFTIKYNFELVL